MYNKPCRLVDPVAYYAAQKFYCEICGTRAYGGAHHVISRGAGGPDHPLNLIQLCAQCHSKVHAGNISRKRLWEIIARRERMTPEGVEEKLYRLKKRGDIL